MGRAAWEGLPAGLQGALEACWSALDARPWEHPPLALQHAVQDALGPAPRVLRGSALAAARAARPDLAARLARDGGALAVEQAGRADELEAARSRLAGALGEPTAARLLDAARVVHLAPDDERWCALRRHAVHALRCAQSVVPMWMHAHPDDERPLALIDAIDAEDEQHALRAALEREIPPSDPALSAMRAIVLAHDLVTGSEARVETTELPELCAYAWLDAPAELVPSARSPEPPARAEAWFRWWLADALPSAWRAA